MQLNNITNKELISFFSKLESNAGFIDKLKIRYRPLICPFAHLLSFADGKENAFDIGCGSGQFAMLLANYTSVQSIHGIEIDERLIGNANELSKQFNSKKNLFFTVFDGKTIPDSISEAEVVYLIDVFHHVPKNQQEEFILEVHKKMNSGAILIFKDINASSPLVLVNKLHDLIFAGEIGNEIGFKEAEKRLVKVGFDVVDAFTKLIFLYPHYFVICRKV
jgi:2-polyprenyl-3-methyl-5-hydroxy-6-metoxy-1,4-benzoquinol methylase